MLGQTLTIEKRPHPYGEKGVRLSLEEVAKRIVNGYQNPRVITYTAECLNRAHKEGRGGDTELSRAQIILKVVQGTLWMPDPVGTEYMAAAHLMACDKSTEGELCILPSDCDDRCVKCGSMFMSCGLHCMVVGHSYNRAKQIEHVLLAVRIGKGKAGRWHYADPSTDWPLGKCLDGGFRERLISLPDMKVRCDDNVCLKKDPSQWDPDASGFVERGTFVGVSGIDPSERPVFAWLAGADEAPATLSGFEWLGSSGRDAAVNASRVGATSACASYPATAAFSTICGDIGAAIGGAIYDGVAEFIDPNKADQRYYRPMQDQARATVATAYTAMRRLLNLTIKQFAVSANVSIGVAAAAIGKYVKIGPPMPLVNGQPFSKQAGGCGQQPFGQGVVLPACCHDWWPGAGTAGTGNEPYVPLPECQNQLVKTDPEENGARVLDVGTLEAGLAIYQSWTNDLLSYALPNAALDLKLAGGKLREASGSGSSTSTKRSYFWPVVGVGAVGGLIWWATRPLG